MVTILVQGCHFSKKKNEQGVMPIYLSSMWFISQHTELQSAYKHG